ncbi:MAG TPA: hypothetical protein VMH80_28515 [Bryobacteraceae bacterium]|nr:hypothetical protein [Bryobacteraceae bacterium]
MTVRAVELFESAFVGSPKQLSYFLCFGIIHIDAQSAAMLPRTSRCLLFGAVSHNLKAMDVHSTPEQEAQIAQLASKAGSDPEHLVKDVVARYLGDEARFLSAVRERFGRSRAR